MELALIAGLGLIGKYISDNKENNNKSIESTELFPNTIDDKVHHLYDTRMIPELDSKFYDMAKDHREKSKIPERTNIIPPYFNQVYQDKLTNNLTMGPVPNSELLSNSISKQESFTSQFDLPTLDNKGEPASVGDSWNSTHRSNILNLERSLATSSGFSPFENETNDMTYGIVPKEHFVHNNMHPSTAQRDMGIKESNNFEYQMEIFTGSSKNWNPKRETIPFFDPEEFKQLPFGAELVTDAERDRIIVPRVRQNERPFEPINVAPGLNLGYDEMPKEGRHDTYRVLFKDTNELRPANKPKLTYEGRSIGAPRKGEKRGVTAPVIQRKADQWRYQDFDDLVPNKAQVTGPSDQGNYIIPENGRMANNFELKGHAKAPTRVGAANREGKVKITKRVTHVEDRLGPKGTEKFNNNLKSFNILNNQRHNTHYNDMMPGTNLNQGIVSYDPNDIAKPTIKQITGTQRYQQMMGQQIGQYSNLNDDAKTTIKQLTATQRYQQMMGTQPGVHASPQDIAKTTNKQTLSEMKFNTVVSRAMNSYANLTDEAKNTVKQIIATQQLNTILGAVQKGSYSNISDDVKTTLKQLLATVEYNNNVKSAQQGSYANPMDIAKTTIKQIIATTELNNNIKGNNQGTVQFTQDARPTHKQDLLNENYVSHISNSSQGTQQVSFDMPMTMKDLTKVIDYRSAAQAGPNHNQPSQHAERNMRQNTAREIISKGVYPTLSGPKLIPTKDNYNSMTVKTRPNFERINAPTFTGKVNLSDRDIFNVQEVKNKAYYDERLYKELLNQFDNNPLVNNVQTTMRLN